MSFEIATEQKTFTRQDISKLSGALRCYNFNQHDQCTVQEVLDTALKFPDHRIVFLHGEDDSRLLHLVNATIASWWLCEHPRPRLTTRIAKIELWGVDDEVPDPEEDEDADSMHDRLREIGFSWLNLKTQLRSAKRSPRPLAKRGAKEVQYKFVTHISAIEQAMPDVAGVFSRGNKLVQAYPADELFRTETDDHGDDEDEEERPASVTPNSGAEDANSFEFDPVPKEDTQKRVSRDLIDDPGHVFVADSRKEKPGLHLLYTKWAIPQLRLIDEFSQKLFGYSQWTMREFGSKVIELREDLVRRDAAFAEADAILGSLNLRVNTSIRSAEDGSSAEPSRRGDNPDEHGF